MKKALPFDANRCAKLNLLLAMNHLSVILGATYAGDAPGGTL
jgi:hypothetical protein